MGSDVMDSLSVRQLSAVIPTDTGSSNSAIEVRNVNADKIIELQGYNGAGVLKLETSNGTAAVTIDGSGATANSRISGNLNVGDTTMDSTAVLSVHSTTKCFSPPLMTEAQKNAITPNTEGSIVMDSTQHALYVWYSAGWHKITAV